MLRRLYQGFPDLTHFEMANLFAGVPCPRRSRDEFSSTRVAFFRPRICRLELRILTPDMDPYVSHAQILIFLANRVLIESSAMTHLTTLSFAYLLYPLRVVQSIGGFQYEIRKAL